MPRDKSKVVWIGGLSGEVTWQELQEHFNQETSPRSFGSEACLARSLGRSCRSTSTKQARLLGSRSTARRRSRAVLASRQQRRLRTPFRHSTVPP